MCLILVNYQTGRGNRNPKFVASWSEVKAVFGPLNLQLVPKVSVVPWKIMSLTYQVWCALWVVRVGSFPQTTFCLISVSSRNNVTWETVKETGDVKSEKKAGDISVGQEAQNGIPDSKWNTRVVCSYGVVAWCLSQRSLEWSVRTWAG